MGDWHDPCIDLTRVDKMNCDQCDNEATVFLTEFSNGEVRKVNLCEHCALERSTGEEGTGLELSDLLWGLGNPDQKVSMEEEPGEQELLCPHCGFTESDFDKTERLGCPQCYGVYAERLSGMWKNFQNGTAHTGKRPRQAEALAAPLATPAPKPVEDLVPETARRKRPAPEEAVDPMVKAAVSAVAKACEEKIAELQAQMAEALREEAYEHAATLRDLIRDQEQLIRDLERGRQLNGESAMSPAPMGTGGTA